MGTYLTIQVKDTSEQNLLDLNQEWVARTGDLLLSKDTPNGTLSNMEPIICFMTRTEIRDWAINVKKDEDQLTRLKCTSNSTLKQISNTLKNAYPNITRLGSNELKLSGGHYCYHIFARVKSFIELHKSEFTVQGFADLVRFIGYYEMVDTSNYCSICKRLAHAVNIQLPLPEGPLSPDLQTKLHEIQTLKDFI